MWETFSFGKTPYPAMSNVEVFEQISNGYRLPSPHNCPPHIYELMQACWKKIPADRPTFKTLYASLEGRNSIEVTYNSNVKLETTEAIYQN
jgi:hypothetical protein